MCFAAIGIREPVRWDGGGYRDRVALCDGAVEVLLKPCPIDTLTTAIENAYERKLIEKEVADRKP